MGRYKIARKDQSLNALDDIKLFAKNEKELKAHVKPVRIYNQTIRMEFGIEKSAMLLREAGNDTYQRNRTTKSRKKSEKYQKKKLTNNLEF